MKGLANESSKIQTLITNMGEKSPEEQEKYAREFSEGSPGLYYLLRTFWLKGLNTYGCCAGHTKFAFNFMEGPFFQVDISSMSPTELKNLITQLLILNNQADEPFMRIELDYQYFDESQRGQSFVAEDERERHNLTIRFNEKDESSYTKMIRTFKKIWFNEKEAAKETNEFLKKNPEFRTFIISAIKLNELSIADYCETKNEEFNSYNSITLSYDYQRKMYMDIIPSTPSAKAVKAINCKTGEFEVVGVSEGYYTESLEGFLTLIDGELQHVTEDDIKRLKLKQFKKNPDYEYYGPFNSDKIIDVVREIKSYTVEDEAEYEL